MQKVSVIIPTMEGREGKLQNLLNTIPRDCERIIVRDKDLLLAAKRNKGARQAKRRYLLFIDDDNYLQPGAIENLVKSMDDETGVMGMVAGYTSDKGKVADGGSLRNYKTGFTKGLYTNELISELPGEPYEVDEVANAFMMRRQVHRKLKGFDESNFPIDLDEADLCKRAKDLGYKIKMNPKAICYHDSITYSHVPDFRRPMNAYFMGRNRVLFQKKLGYMILFLPMFVVSYCVALLYRKKPGMIKHFLKGVWDGLRDRKKNIYQ